MTTTAIHLTDSLYIGSPVYARSTSHFQFPRGIAVTDPSGIHEAYDLVEARKGYWVFTINVSSERISEAFASLVQKVRNPGYFVVEVGTQREVESKLRLQARDPFHVDVHCLDGISRKKAVTTFREYQDLFVHDGRTQAGFGSHHGIDEVYIGPYKIFRIFTDTPAKYVSVLKRLRIQPEERLRTVWKTLTPRTPCRRNVLSDSPETIGRMLARLQSKGLYFAERREDLP